MTSMSSADLVPNDRDSLDPSSNEVQFALVISRMIDTVQHSPEHMRQAVYDLARYKLQEQFSHVDAKDADRTREALEAAIRGVEEFSRQQIELLPPRPAPQLADGSAAAHHPPSGAGPNAASGPAWQVNRDAIAALRKQPLPPLITRTAATLLVVGAILLVFQQRDRLQSLTHDLTGTRVATVQPQVPPPAPIQPIVAPPPAPKPNPLRPTDYGIYAISDDHLVELPLLPGRAPDIRVAVSAALKEPSQTVLANGHPKFIVFRRDSAANAAERAEVRVVAKVAREFSANAAGAKPDEGNATWVIRNVSFPFRSSPMPDNPEMYELHSDDPALELSPGRYALILRGQAYDFTVPGKVTDPQQCIERVVLTTGTLYTDCKKL